MKFQTLHKYGDKDSTAFAEDLKIVAAKGFPMLTGEAREYSDVCTLTVTIKNAQAIFKNIRKNVARN